MHCIAETQCFMTVHYDLVHFLCVKCNKCSFWPTRGPSQPFHRTLLRLSGDVMQCNATRRGNGRRLKTSINGPDKKTKLNQAVVEAPTTEQVTLVKQTTSYQRVGLSRLRRCFQNGGILYHSGLCHLHRRHSRRRSSSTQGTACCFGSATPT